jgi:hypothetical protein
MTERATIFQTVQIGVETTPGTSVAASKKLLALSIEPAVKLETSKFRAMGNKFSSLVVPGKEWVAAKLNGLATYTDIVYALSSLLSYALPAQQGATIAYKWTFAPDTDGPDTKKTFTVEQGSSVRAHKFVYGLVTGMEIEFTRKEIKITGDMIGRALQDGITMTGTPTSIAQIPVLPTGVDVYLADTYAGLAGATALERALMVKWGLTDKYGPLFPIGTANGLGFAADVEIEPKLECKLKMEADTAGMALLTTMRAGSTKFLRVKAVGTLIATTYYYTLTIDTALKVSDVSEFSDEDGVYAIEWTMEGIHDPTWGQATQIEVTNELSTL